LNIGPLEYYYVLTKFNENLPSGSKVISGGPADTHRQAGDLISPLSFLESRLKIVSVDERKFGAYAGFLYA
jgi:hypothetical protein